MVAVFAAAAAAAAGSIWCHLGVRMGFGCVGACAWLRCFMLGRVWGLGEWTRLSLDWLLAVLGLFTIKLVVFMAGLGCLGGAWPRVRLEMT